MGRMVQDDHKSQRKLKKASGRSHRFTSDELLLQPWFLPQRIAFAIRSLAPPDYHLKMRHFFDDYGCMVCKKDHDYGSNGMCHGCMVKIRKRLVRSVRLRLKPPAERPFDVGLIRQAKFRKNSQSHSLGNTAPCKSVGWTAFDQRILLMRPSGLIPSEPECHFTDELAGAEGGVLLPGDESVHSVALVSSALNA